MADDIWGVGNKADSKSFRKVEVKGYGEVDLIHGEHPHSRQDNTTYARDKHGKCHEFSGHHYLMGFKYEQYNYMKESHYSGDEIRKGGTLSFTANGKVFYSCMVRDAREAALKYVALYRKFVEGPIQWWEDAEVEALKGRKIYYRDTPAVIKYMIRDQGCVIIEPEEGHKFPMPGWAKRDGGACYDPDESVKTSILSESIYWYRD